MTVELFPAEIIKIVESQEDFENYQNEKKIRDRDSITIRMDAYSKIARLVKTYKDVLQPAVRPAQPDTHV
jgi:hypothetical protein